jgi:hypothetical protein
VVELCLGAEIHPIGAWLVPAPTAALAITPVATEVVSEG